MYDTATLYAARLTLTRSAVPLPVGSLPIPLPAHPFMIQERAAYA